MKAIVYGPSGTVQLAEIERPVPADDEVLVRVRAASVNALDAHMLKSYPPLRSVMFALMGVKAKRPGADIAGEVEAVGRNVTRFAPGDAVFGGSGGGAFAEYACPRESRLVRKPASLDFASAACINVAARTALQGLRDHAAIAAGDKVLINGASGGVGTFAVQMAKWLGAEVTGVCSGRNLDLVRSIGADHVIDYAIEDFTQSSERYDSIFDLAGNKPLLTLRRILTPSGKWIGAGIVGRDPSMIRMIVGSLKAPALSLFTKQKFKSFITKSGGEDLDVIADLVESGKIRSVIDRTFTLAEVPDAIGYVATKRARGKVVISVVDALI